MTGASWVSIIWAFGEVLISLVALLGGLWVLDYSPDQGAKVAAGGLITGVTVFWFQRRSTGESSATVAMLANGKLSDLIRTQQSTNVQLAALSGQVPGNPPESKPAA